MWPWGGTKEDVRGTTPPLWVEGRLTGTILTLVGTAGVGLLTWSIVGGAPLSDARAALVALLLYVLLCLPLVRVNQAIQDQRRIARAESEERRRQRTRRPYNVVDEADVVLARALGRRGTR